MKISIRIMLICLIIAIMAIGTEADTIKLKNGTVIKGKVINFTGGAFTVTLDLGTGSQSRAIFDMRDVEEIEFDNRPDSNSAASNPTINTPPRPSAPDDDDGHPVRPSAPARTAPPSSAQTTLSQPSTPAPTPRGTLSSSNAKETVAIVPAKSDWTFTNIIVRPGDHLHFSASGKVKLSATRESGPEGVNIEDKNKLLLDKPTGGLIAVIGDDNDDFIYIGRETDLVAARGGKLFLSVNEGDLSDNEGSFNVRIARSSDDGDLRPAVANSTNSAAADRSTRRAADNSGNTGNNVGAPSSAPSSAVKDININVPAKDDWTYANISVQRGDRIKVSASGKVKISPSQQTGPEGIKSEDRDKLLLDKPTGALIAVIGDDNNDFIFIGRENEFVANRDGRLFLSVNEGNLNDNEGEFNVHVRIEPAH